MARFRGWGTVVGVGCIPRNAASLTSVPPRETSTPTPPPRTSGVFPLTLNLKSGFLFSMIEFLRELAKRKELVAVSYKMVGAFKNGIPTVDVVTKSELAKLEIEKFIRGKGISVPDNHFNEKVMEGFKTRFVNVTLSQDHVIEINRALKQGKEF
jgi:hypothetical protein